jgi:membrane associated rhomboid family serine protease
MSSRPNELLRSIPPATLAVLGICIVIFVLQLVLDLELEKFTMCPRLVLFIHEYYRVFTSALFHANFMHIGMNMLSTSAISALLEKRLGTLRHVFSILWAIMLSAAIYIVIAYAAYFFFGYDKWMYQHSVGFSGIIFHMSVLECNLSRSQSRSVFGFFSVPSFLYPWVLLVILQMFMPNLSFLGHLSGIMTGTLQYYGMFEFLLVGESFMTEMESWNSLRCLVRISNFVATPTSSSPLHQEPTALLQSLHRGVWIVAKFVRDVLETFVVCIFGQGHSLNANIRLGGWNASSSSDGGRFLGSGRALGSGGGVEDDDDWVGLPTVASLEKEPLSRLV